MGKQSELIDLLDQLLRDDLGTWAGILKASIGNVLVFGALATALHQASIGIDGKWYGLAIFAVEVYLLVTWIYRRWISPFDTKTLAIGFAINADDESKPLYEDLKSSFVKELDVLELNEYVRVRTIPADVVFNKAKKAERYIERTGLRVLIWGDTTPGTIGGQKTSVFNVRVSFQYQHVDEADRQKITNTISRGVQRGRWAIDHNDTLKDLTVVRGNVLEISLYSLAICLISVRTFDDVERGVKVLESLDRRLMSRTQDDNFPNLGDVHQEIKDLLAGQYKALSEFYEIEKKNPLTAKFWGQKWIELRPGDYDANILAARVAWETGDRPSALKYTSTAAQIASQMKRNHQCAHRLNLGFFQFYDGNYGKALTQYRKIDDSVLKTNIVDVIAFILREYDKTSKPALLYAAGWLSHKYADQRLGKELLHEFQDLTEGNGGYGPLHKEVFKILK